MSSEVCGDHHTLSCSKHILKYRCIFNMLCVYVYRKTCVLLGKHNRVIKGSSRRPSAFISPSFKMHIYALKQKRLARLVSLWLTVQCTVTECVVGRDICELWWCIFEVWMEPYRSGHIYIYVVCLTQMFTH